MATAIVFDTYGTVVKYPIGNAQKSEKWVYDGGTNAAMDVGAPAKKGFKIPTPEIAGDISEIYFESQSTACDIWLCENDVGDGGTLLAATSNETIILLESVNLGYSPALTQPRHFTNRASTDKFLYLVIDNTTTAITQWQLVLTFDRG